MVEAGRSFPADSRIYTVVKKERGEARRSKEERKGRAGQGRGRNTYIRVLPWQLARSEMQAWFLSTVSQTGHHRWYSMRELAPARPPSPPSWGERATRALAAPMRERKAVVWIVLTISISKSRPDQSPSCSSCSLLLGPRFAFRGSRFPVPVSQHHCITLS